MIDVLLDIPNYCTMKNEIIYDEKKDVKNKYKTIKTYLIIDDCDLQSNKKIQNLIYDLVIKYRHHQI